METAVIAAIIGSLGTALVGIIGASKKRSQNKKDQLEHEIKLIEVVNRQNQTSEKIVYELGRLNSSVETIKERMNDFDERLVKIENERY